MKTTIDCKELYKLMENYRRSKTDPAIIISYEAVIDYIDAKINAQSVKLSGMGRAGLARAAFGNPIPQAAYSLIDAIEAHYLNGARPVQPKETT